jgi:hypothetical protein
VLPSSVVGLGRPRRGVCSCGLFDNWIPSSILLTPTPSNTLSQTDVSQPEHNAALEYYHTPTRVSAAAAVPASQHSAAPRSIDGQRAGCAVAHAATVGGA